MTEDRLKVLEKQMKVAKELINAQLGWDKEYKGRIEILENKIKEYYEKCLFLEKQFDNLKKLFKRTLKERE